MNKLVEARLIKKYSIMSFDIFDTLIEREVCLPSDTFVLVGDKCGINGKDFLSHRMRAESVARSKKANHEVSLEDIYEEIKPIYPDIYDELMHTELSIEYEQCKPREAAVGFYKKCIEQGKRTVIISDMYLDYDTIERMLLKCGVKDFDALVISNCYGCSKKTGALFEVAVNKYSLEKEKMIHLGDNLKGDILGAHKAGIDAHYILKNRMPERVLKKAGRIISKKLGKRTL